MLLHYGFAHIQPVVLAGVSLLTFAAGLLVGSWTRSGERASEVTTPRPDADQ